MIPQTLYYFQKYKPIVVDIHGDVGKVAVEVGLFDDAGNYTMIGIRALIINLSI